MPLVEINFDGIIGPSHNYAGLSLGNIASASHARKVSRPREAALQGIAKMRANLDLGLAQAMFFPLDRPNSRWLASLGTDYVAADPHLKAASLSASSMWAANAATVSPDSDTGDGKCHLTVANLQTMPHRSHEWPGMLTQLKLAFAHPSFAVHGPVPSPFGDEGAANHMRLCTTHGAPGVELFVYGVSGGRFPARQHLEASKAVARRHGLDPKRTLFVEQAEAAIAGGAFHNDVVAVANERVLFCHEQAFADRDSTYSAIRAAMPEVEIIEVPTDRVSVADAVASYVFNAQLVTMPHQSGMALILPTEARETPSVWAYLQALIVRNSAIRELITVDVRQSMANGGGPACLRLRVVADPATIDARFLATPEKLDRLGAVIEAHWPQQIAADGIGSRGLIDQIGAARRALLEAAELAELA